MKTFSEKSAIRSYLRLMNELATRIELVAYACDGKLNLSPPYSREYSYLQFRRICELTALGCLQLHGDLAAAKTKSAKKEWNAERIMGLLHRNHSYSFPKSVTRTKTTGGWHIEANSKPNALTLEEFKSLYHKCGQILHRGTIKSIEAEGVIPKAEYEKVASWQRKIVDLMAEHVVERASGKGLYLVSLRTTTGFPACSIFTDFSEGSVKVATYHLKDGSVSDCNSKGSKNNNVT